MADMESDYDAVCQVTVGSAQLVLGVRLRGAALSCIDFLDASCVVRAPVSPAAKEVVRQLTAYFREPHTVFNVSMDLVGSAFAQQVWQALQEIPAGETLTYGELARRLGSSARAVGGACRRNPVPIVVPCHRVVARTGLGGYSGDTAGANVRIKECLLVHERRPRV